MVKIRVPATSANLGSGFDSIGFALKLYNEIWVEEIKEGSLEIVSLDNNELIPKNEENLIYKTISDFYNTKGIKVPNIRITQKDSIPFTRGLGSSAACIAGGLLAANELSKAGLSKEELAVIASRIEGHPDNTNPAIFGGVVTGAITDESMAYVKMDMPESFLYAVLVPDYQVKTSKAREVLPKTVSLSDAIFNCQRASLLVASIGAKKFCNLRVAVEDRLHQPYREKLIPGLYNIFDYAYNNGAVAAFLSGAGPTIICILDESKKEEFNLSMDRDLKNVYGNWTINYYEPDNEGAKIII